MAQIRNMGTATMKFNEGIIVKGQAGDDIHALIVTGSIIATSFTGSATRAVSDQNGETLYGGIDYIDYGLFQNPSSAASVIFFPADDSLVEASNPSTINFNIAQFDGRIEKVIIKSSLNLSTSGLTCSFHKGDNETSTYSSTAAVTRFANGLPAYSSHTFNFGDDVNASLKENEIFGFGLRLNNGFNGTGNFHFSYFVRYFP